MEREGGRRRKRKRKGRWKLDGCSTTERTARQDCIGSWGTDPSRGWSGAKYKRGGWGERYPFSFLRGEWMLRERTAEKMRIPMVHRWKRRERERESVLRCLRSRLCTPVSRPLLPTRSCRFIPVLLPRHTCFREYGAGPRCARIFAARWNFVISIPGNPERVSLPSETSDTAVGKKEKKPRNASRVSARVFPRVACVAFLA